jgi:hypothetical protein
MLKSNEYRPTFVVTILVGLLVLFYSCSKSPKCSGNDKNQGIINHSIDIECVPVKLQENYTITTDSAYRKIFTDTGAAQNFCNLPAIDFNSYSLLGQPASGQCEIKMIREVSRLDSENRYHYKVIVNSCGLCKKESFSDNWVIVPKLPNGWTVTFEVKEE